MKNYDRIRLTEVRHKEAWDQQPQYFSVPGGWEFMTYEDLQWQRAERTLEVALCYAGDWLEIVNEKLNRRVRYSIVPKEDRYVF